MLRYVTDDMLGFLIGSFQTDLQAWEVERYVVLGFLIGSFQTLRGHRTRTLRSSLDSS